MVEDSVKLLKPASLAEVASKSKVAMSTVSNVLRGRGDKMRVSVATQQRIREMAAKLNYVPAANASALVTGKASQIGFILSSKVSLGLTNPYFSEILANVHDVCERAGYRCVVSVCDMASVKKFVVPEKLRRRSVDGVVVAGPVEAGIISALVQFKVPFMSIGDNTDYAQEGFMCVARNIDDEYCAMLDFLFERGHKKVAIEGVSTEKAVDWAGRGYKKFLSFKSGSKLQVQINRCGFEDQIELAKESARRWMSQDKSKRSSAVIAHPAWCAGFLAEINSAGFKCPKDISLIASGDMSLCRCTSPAIAACSTEIGDYAQKGTQILIDILEKRLSRKHAFELTKQQKFQFKIVERDSVGMVPEV